MSHMYNLYKITHLILDQFKPFLSADALSAELDAPKEALKSFANDESDESDIVAPKSANQSDSSSSFLLEF